MIIIGDSRFDCEQLFLVHNIEDLKSTPSNSVVFIKSQNIKLQTFLANNCVEYGIFVNDFKEAIYANNLKAKYIICSQIIVDKLQKIAENYLFDAKILALIDFEEEINKMCEIGVDGVIYGSILKFNALEQI